MIKLSSKAPLNQPYLDASGLVSRAWQSFIRLIMDALDYIGQEDSFDLANNQALAASIPALKFDSGITSQAVIEYLIQRCTSGADTIQSGCLHCVYKPKTNTWTILEYGNPGPSSAGITFSITASGQVQYTSTNIASTVISRICFRVREIKAKHSTYSRAN
jgi:hypothetical protein